MKINTKLLSDEQLHKLYDKLSRFCRIVKQEINSRGLLLLDEETFAISDYDENEKKKFYEIFRDAYMKNTGKSWSLEKFLERTKNWVFFGTSKGFVCIKKEDGLNKMVAVAGEVKDVTLGFQELLSLNEPIYGFLDTKFVVVLKNKYNFILPPNWLCLLLHEIFKSKFEEEITLKGNKFVINYGDIGTVEKYLVGNEDYFTIVIKQLLSNDVNYFYSNCQCKDIVDEYIKKNITIDDCVKQIIKTL